MIIQQFAAGVAFNHWHQAEHFQNGHSVTDPTMTDRKHSTFHG
jgi:hypothetical protein